jgi:cytochrome b561
MPNWTEAAYHPATRWLHTGLVLGVTYQLSFAAIMSHPDEKGGGLGELFMQAHRTGGVIVAAIVVANLIWAILPRGNPPHRQISILVSAAHWCEALSILKRLPAMLLGKRKLVQPGNALALVFEMLGLLTMTAMATTGITIWNLWSGPGSIISPEVELLMETHAFFALLLLIYLVGHISMAVAHLRAGEPVFDRILPFGQ